MKLDKYVCGHLFIETEYFCDTLEVLYHDGKPILNNLLYDIEMKSINRSLGKGFGKFHEDSVYIRTGRFNPTIHLTEYPKPAWIKESICLTHFTENADIYSIKNVGISTWAYEAVVNLAKEYKLTLQIFDIEEKGAFLTPLSVSNRLEHEEFSLALKLSNLGKMRKLEINDSIPTLN